MSRVYVLLLLGSLLGLPLALSGCIGEVQAVYVPHAAVPGDWEHAVVNKTQEAASGIVQITLNHYTRQGGLVGDVYLVGVTNVPAVDEHEEIRKQVRAHTDGQDVQLTETRSFELTLDNGAVASVTEYAIQKQVLGATVNGNAWIMTWDAGGAKAGGVGWATTERPGLFGMEEDASAWQEAQTMLRAADW